MMVGQYEYLFICLSHFGQQVIPLLINFVNEGVQLFAGFLKKTSKHIC